MKKISTVFFTMLLVFSTVSISSCKKEVVPYYKYNIYEDYGGRERLAHFRNGRDEETFEWFDQYNDFDAFYETELTQKRDEHFYFLKPGFEAIYGMSSAMYHKRYFTVYEDKTGNLPTLLVEQIDVYDLNYVALDYDQEPSYTGDVARTANLIYMTVAVPNRINKNVYRLEFGENKEGLWYSDRFINIYVGDFCVATCYYHENIPVTQEWFEIYFRNNLSKR